MKIIYKTNDRMKATAEIKRKKQKELAIEKRFIPHDAEYFLTIQEETNTIDSVIKSYRKEVAKGIGLRET
jgi:hypothetical protein